MDVSPDSGGGGAGAALISESANGSLDVKLHPLVIINASEHFTRLCAQSGKRDVQIFGALLGVQSGRQAEVFNSFELLFTGTEGGAEAPKLDEDYLKQKSEQLKEVFPTLDLLGWYTNGPVVTPQHIAIQGQMTPHNETPLFMLLNTSPSAAMRELPLQFFESIIELGAEDQQTTLFVETGYTLATEEAERIGIDHVAKVKGATGATTTSEVSEHLGAQHSAIDMLYQRIKIIRSYLKAVKAGQLAQDHDVLREVSGLCSRLPIDGEQLNGGKSVQDANDVLLVSYLATITKGTNAVNEMLGKLSVVHDRAGMRRNRAWF